MMEYTVEGRTYEPGHAAGHGIPVPRAALSFFKMDLEEAHWVRRCPTLTAAREAALSIPGWEDDPHDLLSERHASALDTTARLRAFLGETRLEEALNELEREVAERRAARRPRT